MNKLIVFPRKNSKLPKLPSPHNHQDVELKAVANTLTIVLIQQALDDVLLSRDWKGAQRKITVAIKRGHIRRVNGHGHPPH